MGLAHALGKPVIFITQDPPDQTPVDIRAFEFIPYDLGQHEAFLSRIKNAIQSFFRGSYQEFYDEAQDLLRRFNQDTGLICDAVSMDHFQTQIMRAEQTGGGIPPRDNEAKRIGFLLPRIISDFNDQNVFMKYTGWIMDEAFD